MLKNEDLAENATHDIFIKLLLKISNFSNKSRFSTWVYSITYNYCIDQIRKKDKMRTVEIEDFMLDSSNGSDDVEISDAEILELEIEKLEVLLDKISQNDKIILLMKYQDEMSVKEIAEYYNASESAIKMRIKRSKERVRNMAKDYEKVNFISDE
ncbi:hypothetical protein GCM10025777_30370 [Membranihabitans marinus]